MNLPVAEIKTLLDGHATNLCNSLESRDREKVLAAQRIFTETIATLWNTLEENEVDRKIKSVLRLVAGWAIHELPGQILDPVNDEKIKRELKLFQRSLVLIGQ
jgi:hypothetical protein